MISYVQQASRLWVVTLGVACFMHSGLNSALEAAGNSSAYRSGEVVPVEGYVNAKLMSVQVDGIKILHDGGVALIPVEKLSLALQQRYQFDNEVAVEMLREDRAKKEEAALLVTLNQRADASRTHVKGVILQVVKDGVILTDATHVAGKELRTSMVQTGNFLIGTGPSLLNPDAVGVREEVKKEVWVDVWEEFDDVVAVNCDTKDLLEGQPYSKQVYRNGTVNYTAISSDEKHVYYFTESRDRSVKFFRSQHELALDP